MAFVKAIWRFIMGVKDLLVLCFLLLFFAALYAALSLTGGERPVKAQSGALLLDLDGFIVEQPERADPFIALLGGQAPVHQYRLRDVVMALEAARTDPNVKAVVLDLDGFMGGGQVAVTRVAKALDAVRATKKPVLAYATIYDDDSYQLAAHASELWLNPLGGIALTGPGGSQLYFKGLLEKLGVTAHIYRVGTYKSAVEPLIRSDQSPEAEAAAQALADHLWQNWKADVSRARPKAKIEAYSSDPLPMVEAAKGDLSTAAMTAGLVDKLGDHRIFANRVAEIAGKSGRPDGEGPDFAAIDLREYMRSRQPANNGSIGVLTIAGDIVDGEAGPGTAGGDSIAALLDEALATRNLKALVLRVDSPGGSVLASERIRSAVLEAKAKGLPVVASMGNVAASGGYWVSTSADRILAEPSTITGSIGVFGVIPGFEGMLAKIGITADGVKTTPLSGEPDVAGGISPYFSQITQLTIEDIYRRFLGLVSKARNLTPDKVDSIAQGRVWDGGTARQLGLIDGFGGLEEAIAEAARLAKLDPATARPYYIEPEAGPFMQFLEDMVERRSARHSSAGRGDLIARQAMWQEALLARAIRDARRLAQSGSAQAACLECSAYLPAMAGLSGLTSRDTSPFWLRAFLSSTK